MFSGSVALVASVIIFLSDEAYGTCKRISSSPTVLAYYNIVISPPLVDTSSTVINAWAVADTANHLHERYLVDVEYIEGTMFVARVQRIDSNAGWKSSLSLCFDIADVPQSAETVVFGNHVIQYPDPPVNKETNFQSEYNDAKKMFTVLGQTVYLSEVEKEISRYAVEQTTGSDALIDVNITVKSMVFDQPNAVITGIKTLDISATEIFGLENNSVLFKAPVFCQSITSGTCDNSLSPASDATSAGGNGSPGAPGAKGITGPEVEITTTSIEGTFNFRIQGSNGLNGQDGGNGKIGTTPSSTPSRPSCGSGCGGSDLGDHAYKPGYKGYTGGTGGSGAKSGNGGDGGDSGKLSLTINSRNDYDITSGGRQAYVSMTCLSGPPGRPGKPGHGAEGGSGGQGGCGTDCDQDLFSCHSSNWCGGRGSPGDKGAPGLNALTSHPLPLNGINGGVDDNCIIKYD